MTASKSKTSRSRNSRPSAMNSPRSTMTASRNETRSWPSTTSWRPRWKNSRAAPNHELMPLLEISQLEQSFVAPDGSEHTVVNVRSFDLAEKSAGAAGGRKRFGQDHIPELDRRDPNSLTTDFPK